MRLCRGAATVAGGGVAGVVPGSLSAPAPNARRQPAGGHPGSTQRVQRLRQLFVAGDGSEDILHGKTLVNYVFNNHNFFTALRRRRHLRGQLCRANIVRFSPCRQPLGVSLCRAGQPAFRSFAAVSVSSGPSPADVAELYVSAVLPFFSAGAEKREGFLVLNIIIHIEGRRSAGYSPR